MMFKEGWFFFFPTQRLWSQVYELQKSKKSWAFGKMEIPGVEKCVRSFLQQEIQRQPHAAPSYRCLRLSNI